MASVTIGDKTLLVARETWLRERLDRWADGNLTIGRKCRIVAIPDDTPAEDYDDLLAVATGHGKRD